MTQKKISLENDAVLQFIVDELISLHHCHTIILYGSRARGDFTVTSDYDVAGIREKEISNELHALMKHIKFIMIFLFIQRMLLIQFLMNIYVCQMASLLLKKLILAQSY